MEIKEILELKTKIEKAELEKANLEGQIDSIIESLLSKCQIKNINELTDYINKLNQEIDNDEFSLNQKIKELEDELKRNKE